MHDQDITTALAGQVREAAATGRALRVRGGGSKDFYGRTPAGEPIEVAPHRGIVNHAPTELVLTARAGTPLSEIEAVLAEHGQMLPFEPPRFGPAATLGGTIACNLSGPRRPYAGAARDLVLGTRVLNGRGEVLSFGGEVMKNVAGYDVSRLMAGALGTLGVLLEVSVKVLPAPEAELTLAQEAGPADALDRMHAWAARPLPVSATCGDGERLYVRLSGAARAVEAAARQLGGEPLPEAGRFWHAIREQEHGFFSGEGALWRLSVACAAPPIPLSGAWLYEWGGAQRWFRGGADPEAVRAAAAAAGGHATRFRGGRRDDVFHPLSAGLLTLHRRLKQAFDPAGVLNPGRMYGEL